MARTAVNFSGLVRWTNGTRSLLSCILEKASGGRGIYIGPQNEAFLDYLLLNDLGLKCWIVRCPRPASLCPARRFFARWQKTVLRSCTQPDQASRAGERPHISVPEQLPLTTPHSDDNNNNGQSCKGVLRMLSPSTFVLTSLGVALPYHRERQPLHYCDNNSANETNVSVWSTLLHLHLSRAYE